MVVQIWKNLGHSVMKKWNGYVLFCCLFTIFYFFFSIFLSIYFFRQIAGDYRNCYRTKTRQKSQNNETIYQGMFFLVDYLYIIKKYDLDSNWLYYLFQIAHHCFKDTQNFNSMFAITAGLTHSSVYLFICLFTFYSCCLFTFL